jgi:mRNA deadenylase 3'-5' endonuclease subunit Ccr4
MSSITIASYNILADAYMRPRWFAHCLPEHLDPSWRRPALASRIEELDADVVCLQEVEDEAFRAIAQRLEPRGYAGHHALKAKGQPEGCAVFYRSDMLAMRSVRSLVYADRGQGAEDSGHIAQILHFERDGRRMTVANTHIRWDRPSLHGMDHVGVRQARELVDSLSSAGDRVVVCGDLNATADSDVLAELLSSGLCDPYAESKDAFTCNANARCRRIDFILHGTAFASAPRAIRSIEDHTPLPNDSEPSDHLPIAATLDD